MAIQIHLLNRWREQKAPVLRTFNILAERDAAFEPHQPQQRAFKRKKSETKGKDFSRRRSCVVENKGKLKERTAMKPILADPKAVPPARRRGQ